MYNDSYEVDATVHAYNISYGSVNPPRTLNTKVSCSVTTGKEYDLLEMKKALMLIFS